MTMGFHLPVINKVKQMAPPLSKQPQPGVTSKLSLCECIGFCKVVNMHASTTHLRTLLA